MAGVTSVVIDGTTYMVDDINAVDFSEDQGLSEQQQEQGRSNIGAASTASLADKADKADLDALEGTVGDLSDDVDGLTEALADKADVILDTASGAIASFPDGAAAPAKNVTIGIEPVQAGNGDPSPTNVRPISGWTGANVTRTGKNILNPNDYIISGFLNNDGTINSNTSWSVSNYIPVLANVNYTLSMDVIGNSPSYCIYDSNKNFIFGEKYSDRTTATISVPASGAYIRVSLPTNYAFNYQLELGSTATAYEPYTGTTHSISWQSVAGTIYDGTLIINENGTGELRKRPYYASYNSETLIGLWLSSMDVYSPGATPTIGAQVVDLGGTETVYQLTDQQVIDMLYGTNNICADCGDVEVEYRADTKLYIQKINAPTDDDMIADAQIASGKYFIIGGNLYKSTTTIPAGDTINPGSNCILTNLADALNALNT